MINDVKHLVGRSITAKIMVGNVALFVGGLLTIGLMLFMVNRQRTDAGAINEAGSLRMLIQRVAKAGAVDHHDELRQAVAAFDRRLTGLIEGRPEKGIEPAPPRVRSRLQEVREQWRSYREIALRLLEEDPGTTSYQAARQYLITHDARLHRVAHQAVEQYQAESEGKIGQMRTWLYGLLGLAVVVFGSVFWITRQALRPVHALVEATDQVREGQLNTSADVDTDDELGRLADSFNRMVESIQEAQEDLQREKKRAEEMNRLKSALLANMSHEIRTPLSAIIGFSEVLGEEVQQAADDCSPSTVETVQRTLEDVADHANLIRDSGQRLMNTLDSVLELSKLEADVVELQPVRVDVQSELRDVVDTFRQRAADQDIDLQMEPCEAPLWCTLDVGAVRRIVTHLLSNALKFTKSGGEVRMSAHATPDSLRLEIADSGIGIAEDFLPDLFEPFKQESAGMTRSYNGIGLGLTIVRRLTALMDGRIDVESAKGEGTRVVVTLPRHVQYASRIEDHVQGATPVRTG